MSKRRFMLIPVAALIWMTLIWPLYNGSSMFAIFGAGGFGRELVRPAREMLGERSGELVFVADAPQEPVLDVPVLTPDRLTAEDDVVIAIGNSAARKAVASRLAARPGRLIARTALIGPGAEIGEGAVLCDYTMVTASARIGAHFQCNIYSYVAHDCEIGDFVTFAPRVCCNGRVHIGDGAYIGTGAVLRDGTREKPLIIGENAVIGMGAVVTRDVPAGVTVIGNPARPLERKG
jgi:sugar O-acyltransferase (sialic acid O-acetyltransferase NeuD family)